MINRLNGYFCTSLLLLFGLQAVRAQPPATPPTPPAQQSPATQASPGTGQGPQVQAPPELPKYPDVRLPGEYGFWIAADVWQPREQPIFDKGHAALNTQSSNLTMEGHPREAVGGEVGIALGLHNALRISYFRAQASGDLTPAVDTVVPGQLYSAGTPVATNYTLQRYKISFDYLTWPYPVQSRRFRLMTLWQFTYMTMRTGFDAPTLPLVDSNGNPYIGADGNPISYASSISKSIISPEIGLGLHEYISKHFRLELNGTGFAVPHHWTIWEADATANIRIKQFEVAFGAKGMHYKTSPAQDYFTRNTMLSPFVSLKWFSQ